MVQIYFKRMIFSFLGLFIFCTCYPSYILAWPWDKPKAKMEEKKIPKAQPTARESSVNKPEASDQEHELALHEDLAQQDSASETNFDEVNLSDQELKEPTWVKTTEETQGKAVRSIPTAFQPVKIQSPPVKIFRPVQRIQPAFQLPFRPVMIVRPATGGAENAAPAHKGSSSKEKKLKDKTEKNQKEA